MERDRERAYEDLPVVEGLDELTSLVERDHGLYLRYSQGPQRDGEGPSKDYESGLELPGLSVTVLSAEDWWERPLADWVARQVCKYVDLAEQGESRRAWVLRGRVVGHGPDHEPLLVDVTPVAWVGDEAVRQARARYEERFDVGRDSTGRSDDD
ncbi:DUF6098 family protein [Marinactinospora thermotolerans]|uniref:Uncharacterized protein n=1 Tax=Marinactinospora thermotolerans DSM 45154 TaxID=1122192 RepID=A0A1T4RRL3_9ACTN|nr:DUF6098 family protein [Marinactinospora thermotolerans]SKA18639.1 hypothetical protein SAMN02745673_02923 [Marinactinospora thermotolerans DSM 45154]